MAASVAQDSFGNNNTQATQLSRTYDGRDPDVTLTTSGAMITNVPFTVIATFTESMTGITSSMFSATNADRTNFSALSATQYSVLITPLSN